MRESVIYQSILEEGREEGAEQKTRQLVVNFLKEGASIDLVAKATGLTIEQIQQIQASQPSE
jgi:predicted transposase/invertase (TIGR01784 family)